MVWRKAPPCGNRTSVANSCRQSRTTQTSWRCGIGVSGLLPCGFRNPRNGRGMMSGNGICDRTAGTNRGSCCAIEGDRVVTGAPPAPTGMSKADGTRRFRRCAAMPVGRLWIRAIGRMRLEGVSWGSGHVRSLMLAGCLVIGSSLFCFGSSYRALAAAP